ncbi:PREDICTED: uncharacterized protein LOC109163965 [Ipomoea nil]|uniref:uncharacterized protein LOC109163965 n=1 Tax=Ipomoea nil TaxID=35883 RepID=UPI000900BBF0|nr:PREDICTED: uncharacterized protein LOC109163965 [Ipomoea nil]
MRCKKHLSDLSSVVGVCATCLREKLFVLIEAQAHLQQAQEQRRSSNADPAAARIVFPQSVSPYASRRESDTAATWCLSRHGLADQRFHATPQVGPTGELISGSEYANKKDKKKNSRFSLFYHMFRSKSGDLDSDSERRVSNSDDRCNTMPSSSPSWFSTIVAGRRGRKTRSLSLDEATVGVRQRTLRNCDRGMSPARYSDEENEEDSSGQSSPAWKQTPRRTPAYQRGGGGGKAGLSRNAFCLSPLVWASPNQRWSQKGMQPPEMAYPGEIRSPAKSRFHNATSFCKNRSRKLADFGRSRHNH